MTHAPSLWAPQAVTAEHAPLCYLCCPDMTSLDWGEAVQTYKGKISHTPGNTQYFQVCVSRKNLNKKRVTLKPKGNTLFQENEVHFRDKSKATITTLREHPHSLWKKEVGKDGSTNSKADLGKSNF